MNAPLLLRLISFVGDLAPFINLSHNTGLRSIHIAILSEIRDCELTLMLLGQITSPHLQRVILSKTIDGTELQNVLWNRLDNLMGQLRYAQLKELDLSSFARSEQIIRDQMPLCHSRGILCFVEEQ